MSRFWQHFITNGFRDPPQPTPSEPTPEDDAEALDAFSSVIVRVAETIRPAVVHLSAGRGRREGSGSGILRNIVIGIVGALIAAGPLGISFAKIMGFIAVTLAAVNIFGGFIVTQRMLQMFQKKR